MNTIAAAIFHPSTTILFAYAYMNSKGRVALVAMVLAYWFLDSLTAYWHCNPSFLVLCLIYTFMALIVCAILFKLLPIAKSNYRESLMWMYPLNVPYAKNVIKITLNKLK